MEKSTMPTLTSVVLHNRRTTRSEYQFLSAPKHHGADPGAGQWLPSLSLDEEFAIFDTADVHEISDDYGRLYSVQPEDYESLRYIGVWHEQVAEFPAAENGEAWHGYPVYPLVDEGPENRRGEKSRPDKIVFRKMVRAGLINESQRRRLMKGDHA